MRISDVVKHKGDQVITIRSDATVGELLALLSEHRIGAVVVSDDGEGVNGIVSERDVVRHLHSAGPSVLDGQVGAIMTREVRTCTLDDSLDDLENQMTEHRIRHVPVVQEGREEDLRLVRKKGLPAGSPLRTHVLYRIGRDRWHAEAA